MQAVAERIRAILFLVHPILAAVVAETAKQDGQKTVKAHASQIMSMKHGLATGSVTTVRTSRQITIVLNVLPVFQSG